jgi:hypothetical protein
LGDHSSKSVHFGHIAASLLLVALDGDPGLLPRNCKGVGLGSEPQACAREVTSAGLLLCAAPSAGSCACPGPHAGRPNHLGNRDLGIDGVVKHPPGSGLVRRHGGQIGEVEAAVLSHGACARTHLGVEPHRPERLPADSTRSRFDGLMLRI